MENTIQIECPQELLLGLHVNVETFADMVKLEAAVNLFKQGRISSGMAAKWLDISRISFLIKAMEGGASLLDDSLDDFQRETSQL
ncbi:MAG: UPF0175 family protein [Candidatus Kuenenia sp.]|nr:UPF0175 family protein [Candidatus Kuenenia sp.]